MSPIKDGKIPVLIEELAELKRKADLYDSGDVGSIDPSKHGMVVLLDGQRATVYDEGREIRYITELEVRSMPNEFAEVSLKKIVPGVSNGTEYRFEDIEEDE